MILVIDNYDSFVFNLARYVEELDKKVIIFRNDKITIEEIFKINPTHIIISPGPRGPIEAGISIDVVKKFAGIIPILGVCLGHQVIGHVFGGAVIRAKKPMHGKSSIIEHDSKGIFTGVPSPLKVGRYHSLIVTDKNLSKEIEVTSRSKEGEVMSLASKKLKLVGVQFHPESVLTDYGHLLVNNFIRLV
jgi:para-aminobenzoate synthetase component 2